MPADAVALPRDLPIHCRAVLEQDCDLARQRTARWIITNRDIVQGPAITQARTEAATLFRESGNLRQMAAVSADSLSLARFLSPLPLSEDDCALLLREYQGEAVAGWAQMSAAQKTAALILRTAQDSYYPWLGRTDDPTAEELALAIQHVTSMRARQLADTHLRQVNGRRLEAALRALCVAAGYEQVTVKGSIDRIDALTPGQFCAGDKTTGKTGLTAKADLVVRLFDGRLLIVEAKYSGSEVNSEKRIKHECSAKGTRWRKSFPDAVIVAFIDGAIRADQPAGLQDLGIRVVWPHKLLPLRALLGDHGNASGLAALPNELRDNR